MAIEYESLWDGGERELSSESRRWVGSLPLEQEMMARAMRKLARYYRHDDEPALRTVARVMADAEAQAVRLEIELDEAFQLEQLMRPIKVRFPLGDLTDPLDPHIWN